MITTAKQNPFVWSEERFAFTVGQGRKLLAQGGDINGVIGLARDEGLPFIQCVRLLTRLGVSLAEAKPLAHNNPLYAESRQDREDFWEELAEVAFQITEPRPVPRSAGDDTNPGQREPHSTT